MRVASKFVGGRPPSASAGRLGSRPWLQVMNGPNGEPWPRYKCVGTQVSCIESSRIHDFIQNAGSPNPEETWRRLVASPYSPSSEPVENSGIKLMPVFEKFSRMPQEPLTRCWDPVSAPEAPAWAWLLPQLMKEIGERRFDEALAILKAWDSHFSRGVWRVSVHMGATALILSNPQRAIEVLEGIKELRLHWKAVKVLKRSPEVVNALIDSQAQMGVRGMSSLLRAVWTRSDAGAAAVTRAARVTLLPPRLYPWIVKQLSTVGDASTLDIIFDQFLPRLGPQRGLRGVVLHSLVVRLLGDNNVHSVAPVLDAWHGMVPERTWMTLFRYFRLRGRPDKAEETMRLALDQYQNVTTPFIGEWLSFVAQYYGPSMVVQSLVTAVPSMEPVLDKLGILNWISSQHRGAFDDVRPPVTVTEAQVRRKPQDVMDEAWLSTTYRSILSRIESPSEAVELWEAYRNWTIATKSEPTMAVADQFVLRLTLLHSNEAVVTAERIFLDALELPVSIPANGRHNARSLEALCYALTHPVYGDAKHAAHLAAIAFDSAGIPSRGRAVEPLLRSLNEEQRQAFTKWASQYGAFVSSSKTDPALEQQSESVSSLN